MKLQRFDDPRLTVLPTHSHAVRAGDTVYVAGQVGLRKDETAPPAQFEDEVEIALDALEAALAAAGSSPANVVRTNCYLADIGLLPRFNEVYLRRFGAHRPARTTIQAQLAHGLRFEIDAIAVCD